MNFKNLISQTITAFLNFKISRKSLRRKSYQKKYRMSLRNWLIYHQKKVVFDKVSWMGLPVWKNVLDAWIYQEIIYETRPDILIEIGSKFGGSTRYFADLFELLRHGMVISIDLDRSEYRLEHDRVTLITGNSSDPQVVNQVECLCRGKRVMVIQDGGHKKNQVYQDLLNYSPFVSLENYFIVEDGIVDLFHFGDGLGFDTSGPLDAVEEFLKNHPNFVQDDSRERYLLTYNPKGYLKRIS